MQCKNESDSKIDPFQFLEKTINLSNMGESI